jgi:hypothetical protein
MARSELGNFAQRLGTPSCVVICGVLGTVADELTLPTSTTNSLSSPSRTRWRKSETRPFPDTSAICPRDGLSGNNLCKMPSCPGLNAWILVLSRPVIVPGPERP